jgi:NitT/TauT family transport system ATP-binding protein
VQRGADATLGGHDRPHAPPVLRLERVGKRYASDRPAALEDVSLEAREGELLAIVGASGCGKTTLLRIAAGLTAPTEGVVLLDGRPVVHPPREVAIVFQDYVRSLFPWLTVLRNVTFPLHGMPRARKITRAREVLEEMGLHDVEGSYPWQLSGGMQQRVAIARALVSRPEVLLLDEPFASVDALTRAELQDVLLRVHSSREGRPVTIVHVTHDIDEAVYLGDRIVVMRRSPGRIVGSVDVELVRPRSQTVTRSEPRFLEARNAIHAMIATHGTKGVPSGPYER